MELQKVYEAVMFERGGNVVGNNARRDVECVVTGMNVCLYILTISTFLVWNV